MSHHHQPLPLSTATEQFYILPKVPTCMAGPTNQDDTAPAPTQWSASSTASSALPQNKSAQQHMLPLGGQSETLPTPEPLVFGLNGKKVVLAPGTDVFVSLNDYLRAQPFLRGTVRFLGGFRGAHVVE